MQVLQNAAYSHLDPARGFDGGVNNFYRLIYRTLTTQGAAPGAEGTKIVPDLATDTGKPSDGGKTWTFTLKDGLFFETGAPITSADVKWGVVPGLGSRDRHRLAVRASSSSTRRRRTRARTSRVTCRRSRRRTRRRSSST